VVGKGEGLGTPGFGWGGFLPGFAGDKGGELERGTLKGRRAAVERVYLVLTSRRGGGESPTEIPASIREEAVKGEEP